MARRNTAAWMAALGALLLIMAAQPHGQQKTTAQKPTAQKSATQKAPAAQKPAVKQQTMTLTGCLKMEGDAYELTNLTGSQAPTGRSWKTGFIKKTPKNVQVVPGSASLTLWDQVNRQVSVVGIKDGETHMRASSIRRVAASCS